MNALLVRALLAALLLIALPVHAQEPTDPALSDPSHESTEGADQGDDPGMADYPADPALAEEPAGDDQDQQPAYEPEDPALAAQPGDAAETDVPLFSQAELDQMLAPVALYPDELLSQLLMAATYPLEVVEAARWSRANADLKGRDAVQAVEDKEWDPSVKSLVAFPALLARMDTDLDWTKRLGDAFLAQQDQVMDTVQEMRKRAEDQGNLESNDHVEVQHDGGTIVMHDRYPDVAYVPYYSPYEVYGTWWWPAYGPVYWDPWPGYYYSNSYYWYGPSIWIGNGFYYGHCDWHHREIHVVQATPFYYRRSRPVNDVWMHEYRHRRGVPYRSEREHTRYAGGGGAAATRDRPHRAARSTGDQTRPSTNPVAGSSVARDPRRAPDRSGAPGREHNDARTGTSHPEPTQPAPTTSPSAPVTAQGGSTRPQPSTSPQRTEPRATRPERSYTQPSAAQRPEHGTPQHSERTDTQPQQRAPERTHTPPATPQPRAPERGYTRPSTPPSVPDRSYSRPSAPAQSAPDRSYSRPAAPQPSAPVPQPRATPSEPRSAPQSDDSGSSRNPGTHNDRGRPQAYNTSRPQPRHEAPRQQSYAAAQPRPQQHEAPRQSRPQQPERNSRSNSDKEVASRDDGARAGSHGKSRRER